MGTVGYVDVSYADLYVSTHFLSTDELRTNWEKLSPADKEVLLRRSFEAIESLPFTGRPASKDQQTAFPRWPTKEVPDNVKAAQVENAISLSDSSSVEDAAFYERLYQFGVESYSIGNLSEQVGSGSWGSGSTAAHGIVSVKASRLLQPYIRGSYDIRGGR